MHILPRAFYDRDTPQVARDLIGKKIIRTCNGNRVVGIIAETEAYRSDDPACHAHRGKTQRNSDLFGPVGHTYVYLCYGIHHCLNLVCRDTKQYPAGGVLIRAVIPIEGLDADYINGPGNVAKVFGIDRSHRGIDVTDSSSEIIIAEGMAYDPNAIQVTGRIGLSVAQDTPWRFVVHKAVTF